MPRNEPEDVAKAIVIRATANRGGSDQTHGNAKLPFAGKMLCVCSTYSEGETV